MTRICKIFFSGMLISFIATLSPSSLNITATHIAVSDSVFSSALFCLGCIIIETVCLCIALAAMDWIRKREQLFRLLEYVTVIMILILSFSSFAAAIDVTARKDDFLLSSHIDPFLLGLFVNILNPMHIPFWLGWTTILMEKNVLSPTKLNYVIYVTGITIGTIGGFAGFVYGGNLLVQQFSSSQLIINWVAGLALLITALIHLYKLYFKYSLKATKTVAYRSKESLLGNQNLVVNE